MLVIFKIQYVIRTFVNLILSSSHLTFFNNFILLQDSTVFQLILALVNAIVVFKLDYRNRLYAGVPNEHLNRNHWLKFLG